MKKTYFISAIAGFAALGTGTVYAHEVSQPAEGSEMHWIDHLNDPKPDQAARPRGAEGPIRGESVTQYCDPALAPYYTTLGFGENDGNYTCPPQTMREGGMHMGK